jgi:segregation and condensation protein A
MANEMQNSDQSAMAMQGLVTAPHEQLASSDKYQVTLPSWTGPYDILLQVIDDQEMNLLDLDISTLLEHYLAYIEALEVINLDEAGDFLVVAASLAQIKSKLLLPKDETLAEVEEKDPREDLVRYLMEYQKIKVAAELLKDRPLLGRDVFVKGAKEQFEGVVGEGHGTLYQLVRGFQNVMRELKADQGYAIEMEEVNVSERLHEIFMALKDARELDFAQILSERRTKVAVIASFLAILELVRLNKLKIYQVSKDTPLYLRLVEGAEDDISVHSEFDGVTAENAEELVEAQI